MHRKNSKKKIILAVIAVIVGIGIIIGFSIFNKYKSYKDQVNSMVFQDIDISTIPDGVYIGESDTGVIYAKVEVTVENGMLLNINLLEHRNERGEAAEVIVDHMVQEQNIGVDAISSATNSSKVIRMAVEHALTGNNHQAIVI